MSKIAIVADSTAYIPKSWVEEYNIAVVPLLVIWGDDQFKDDVDITSTEFFQRLPEAKVMPSTSQPSPADFKEVYSRLIDEGKEILSIHISSKLSGTIDSATQAKAEFPNAKIEIVDTLSAAMGEGFPLLLAAKAAQAGKSLEECAEVARHASQHTRVYLAVDTLEFLHRGGRIGGGSRFLGTALQLKPLLQVLEGKIEALERVRTRKKSLARLIKIAVENIGEQQPAYLCVLHANAEVEAQAVLDELSSKVENKEAILTYVSPVIGTHTGPGTVGIVTMAGYDF